jgi:ion channel-forming bestrophin family protein
MIGQNHRQTRSRSSSDTSQSSSKSKTRLHHRNVVAARSFKEKFGIYTGERLHGLDVTQRLFRTVLHGVFPWILLCAGYGFAVSLLNQLGMLPPIFKDSKVVQNLVIGFNIVLSLLLVFRTNTAHDRFWEGRKLWGSMVNTSRNLARDIWLMVEQHDPQDRLDKEASVLLVASFPVAMKLHLRREAMNSELEPLMSPMQYQKLHGVNHAPLEISYWIGDYLQYQYERQQLNVFQLTALHKLVDDLVDILGGCERILKTPVPLIYTITLNALLWMYFAILPFQLVGGLTWWTGPALASMSFLYLTINEVGAEIEEPFGHDPNDLPLDAICNTILRNLHDLIQQSPSAMRNRPRLGNVIDLPRRAA